MMSIDPAPLTENPKGTRRSPADIEQALSHVRQALHGLEYGQISIVVQDGVVIQIERTERRRLRGRSKK